MVRDGGSYLASLKDGRRIFYRGSLVEDVVEHPILGVTARHTAHLYDLQADPELAGALVGEDPRTGEPVSRFFLPPRDPESLRERGTLIYETTRRSRVVFNIAKVIGSDALFALLTVTRQMDETLGSEYRPRVEAFLKQVALTDQAILTAQTDVKGNRSLRPHQQADRDLYVRIKERTRDGIVVSGAKAHITQGPVAEELMVIPSRAMTEADADHAVAFAIRPNTPGVTMICRPLLEVEGARHPLEGPRVLRNALVEALVIFEDVFVPWERVFLAGEADFAGTVANTFALWHRYSALRYRAAQADLLVGLAMELAEANGIETKGHIRRNLADLILFAETQRMSAEMAATHARQDPAAGIALPNVLYTNLGKLYSNTRYLQAIQSLIDCAGGLTVTAPAGEDLDNPETRPLLERYLAGAEPGDGVRRLRLFLLARELVGLLGGLESVTMVHAEGSIEASVMELVRTHDFTTSRRLVSEIIG